MNSNSKITTNEEDFSFSKEEREIAFVKKDTINGQIKWYVYSSDGVKIAEAKTREFAFILASHNDFDPQSAH